jgi:regulatory helix-turn-helix LysR family protein
MLRRLTAVIAIQVPQKLMRGITTIHWFRDSLVSITVPPIRATVPWGPGHRKRFSMYPGIELRLLRYSVVLAEELHFTRAALRLHVAQATLSKQIGDLERELGVTLFDRKSRHVELTREGRNFVRYARMAVICAERGVQLAKRGSISKDHLVSIGYSPRMNLRTTVDRSKPLDLGEARIQAGPHQFYTPVIKYRLFCTGVFAPDSSPCPLKTNLWS